MACRGGDSPSIPAIGTIATVLAGLASPPSSFLTTESELFRRRRRSSSGKMSLPSTFLFAMGQAKPRSLPLLATPTPQVNVVLYPEHSLPMSMHCVQYGRFRSHFTPRFPQAKQSSVAPPPAVLRLLFLGGGPDMPFGSMEASLVGAMMVDVMPNSDGRCSHDHVLFTESGGRKILLERRGEKRRRLVGSTSTGPLNTGSADATYFSPGLHRYCTDWTGGKHIDYRECGAGSRSG